MARLIIFKYTALVNSNYMESNILENIIHHNEGRKPDLLEMKYRGMGKSIFKFYRSTATVFYQDVSANNFLLNSPKVWACGDLHFENFGSYKGDNGLVYFDINDFDEATLAPCLFDIARFLVSVVLLAETEGYPEEGAIMLCEAFVASYTETLATGNSRWVEKQTASGVIKNLLENVERRKPLYKVYTNKVGGSRQFDFTHKKLIPPTAEEKKHILEIIRNWHLLSKAKNIYNILDLAYHIKGSGSLGIKRYILLVQHKSDNTYKLVDLKMSTPPCLNQYVTHITQPQWKNEAERTVEIQKRVQGTSQALLESIETNESSFVLREYQSHEDKVRLRMCRGKINEVKEIITTMAKITAWGQLQSGGRQGSCITDELIEFSQNNSSWSKDIMTFTFQYADKVRNDYKEFCKPKFQNML